MKEQPTHGTNLACIFLVLGIPATGKSTLFSSIKAYYHQQQQKSPMYVEIVSSDEIRNKNMVELMSKEGIEKREAYLRVKEIADEEYWRTLQDILTRISNSEGAGNYAIFMDKNYYFETLGPAIQRIRHLQQLTNKFTNLRIGLVAILPKCQQVLSISNSTYPFSLSFLACCLKRVVSRAHHPTLEGSDAYRVSVGLGWANNFRNFDVGALRGQNGGEGLVDGVMGMEFTREQTVPEEIGGCIRGILVESQVGKYDEHKDVQKLVELLKVWKNEETNAQDKMMDIGNALQNLFTDFRAKIDL